MHRGPEYLQAMKWGSGAIWVTAAHEGSQIHRKSYTLWQQGFDVVGLLLPPSNGSPSS